MRLLLKNKFPQAILSKVLLVSGLLFAQGCTTTNDQHSVIGELIIAEPIAINVKDEIALERLTQVLQRAKINDEQRAELYYQRGIKYDKFGLRALAHNDFNQAINLKPDMVDAYNFLGIHFIQLQEFNQSYDAFDSVIDQQQAEQDLIASAKLIDDSVWAKNVINLYLGKMSQELFIKLLTENIHTNQALTERLCEAYFYLGKYSQMQGDVNAAINFFKLAMSTNVYEFVEHRYAKLELDLMRQNLQQNSTP